MGCKAVENGEVSHKGKSSIEFYKNGKPQYYCYGWCSGSSEYLLQTCRNCKKYIDYAQQDLEKLKELEEE